MIETQRLILRNWREEDRAPYAALNADPEVMAHFPRVQTREESDGFIDRRSAEITKQGYGFFALEIKDTHEFVGFTGLTTAHIDVPFAPALEVGWRLARAHWGKGYATEAALACLDYARDILKAKEIVAFTSKDNTPSMAVMHRLGMTRDLHSDFMHPNIDPNNPAAPHVLYRLEL
jgi:RimJ/RimL family protein N-acetyltransferase